MNLLRLLLFSLLCTRAFAQFGVEQPMFSAPAAAASASGCNFDPASLANLKFWLAADYGVTNSGPTYPTVTDTQIISWADKSTNGYWFTNYHNKAGPQWFTNQTPNGLPAIKANISLSRLVGKTPQIFAQPNTIFVVHKTPAGLGTTVVFTSTNNSAGFENRLYLTDSSGEKMSMYAGSFLTTASIAGSTWYITSMVFNGANSQIRTNGVLGASGDAGANSMHGVNLLAFADGTSVYNNPFSEMLLYNGLLNSNQIYQVENYLACKYQITNSALPGL